jgi:hypothetical protein
MQTGGRLKILRADIGRDSQRGGFAWECERGKSLVPHGYCRGFSYCCIGVRGEIDSPKEIGKTQ